MDDYTQIYLLEPPYSQGDRVVLFLAKSDFFGENAYNTFYLVHEGEIYRVWNEESSPRIIMRQLPQFTIESLATEINKELHRTIPTAGPDDVLVDYQWEVVAQNVKDLVEYFDLIVLGKIAEVGVFVVEEHITYTSYRFELENRYTSLRKGPVLFNRCNQDIGEDDSIIIQNPGGEVDGVKHFFPSSPPLRVGDELILFLTWINIKKHTQSTLKADTTSMLMFIRSTSSALRQWGCRAYKINLHFPVNL